jgi:hypothetical protein
MQTLEREPFRRPVADKRIAGTLFTVSDRSMPAGSKRTINPQTGPQLQLLWRRMSAIGTWRAIEALSQFPAP